MDLDLIKITVRVLKIFGVWVTKRSSRWYILYAVIMQGLFAYGFLFTMGMYIVNVSNIIDFADQMAYFCTYIVCCLKCINICLQSGKIEAIFFELKECMDTYGLSKSHGEHMKRASWVLRSYWLATFSTVFLAGFIPFFSDKLAYRMWFPYKLNNPILYYFSASYQWIGSICYSSANVMMDMLPVLLFAYYIALLDHLAENIHLIFEEKCAAKRKKLITCVVYQLKIINLIRKTEKIFAILLCIQGLFSSIILCTTSFALTTLSFPKDIGIMNKFISYMLAMTTQIFIPCYYASELKITYAKITDSFFHSKWMYADNEFRQNMKFIMKYLQKPMEIVGFGFIRIDLENFMAICNSAFSLFSVFKSVN